MDVYGLVGPSKAISRAKSEDELTIGFNVKLGPVKSKGVQEPHCPGDGTGVHSWLLHRYLGNADFVVREWENLKEIAGKGKVIASPAGRMRRFPTRANKAIERQFR